MTEPAEFSVILNVNDIGGATKRLMLEAGAEQRAALSGRFGLLSLDMLNAALELNRDAAGIHISGQVHGQGSQPCVASGEPVPFLITERIALKLVAKLPEGSEIELSSEDLDVEPLLGDTVDVGEIAAQAFALGLDPYPRSAAKVVGLITEEDAVAARSPFAVLKKG